VYAINSKIFFLNRLLLWGVILDLDKYIFPWQTCFLEGSSYIRVALDLCKYGSIYGCGHNIHTKTSLQMIKKDIHRHHDDLLYSLSFHSVHPVTNVTSDTSRSVYIPYIT
jgi:hypothetical protein